MHVAVHAVSQQRPSAQKPLKQSAMPFEHVWPFSFLHAPAPSHDCEPPEQAFVGLLSSLPLAMFVQVPSLPPMLQAMHVMPQAFSQQRPSTQLFDKQSAAAVHVCPWTRLQTPLPSHWLLPVHVIDAFMSC